MNLRESIRKVLKEERNDYEMFIIRRFDIIDEILKQELEDQEPCYWKDKYKDKDGRVIILNIELEDNSFTLINIYAPNNEHERKKFYKI